MDPKSAHASWFFALRNFYTGEIAQPPQPTLRCRLGLHHWRRWTFMRGEAASSPQRDKQYRYCNACNLCDERPLGFYPQD